jgi:hypothetical protein
VERGKNAMGWILIPINKGDFYGTKFKRYG